MFKQECIEQLHLLMLEILEARPHLQLRRLQRQLILLFEIVYQLQEVLLLLKEQGQQLLLYLMVKMQLFIQMVVMKFTAP